MDKLRPEFRYAWSVRTVHKRHTCSMTLKEREFSTHVDRPLLPLSSESQREGRLLLPLVDRIEDDADGDPPPPLLPVTESTVNKREREITEGDS